MTIAIALVPGLVASDSLTEHPIDSQAVADMLGMHVQEVRRFVRHKSMPAYRPRGTKRQFLFRSEILDWIRSHPVGPGED